MKKPAVSLFGLDDDDDDFLGAAGDDLFGDLSKPPQAMAGASGSAPAAAAPPITTAVPAKSKPGKSLFAEDEDDDMFSDAPKATAAAAEPDAGTAAQEEEEEEAEAEAAQPAAAVTVRSELAYLHGVQRQRGTLCWGKNKVQHWFALSCCLNYLHACIVTVSCTVPVCNQSHVSSRPRRRCPLVSCAAGLVT